MTDPSQNPMIRSFDELPTGSGINNDPGQSSDRSRSNDVPDPNLLDWREIDPQTIQGDQIPVEELRFYQESLEEMLRDGPGQYVLIVGRHLIAYYPDLDSAAAAADKRFRGQSILIKKVARFEPIQTLGGVVG